jgi:hypothetical protein
VGVHPDSQPTCHFFDELDDVVSNFDFGCEFWPEVILVASPECEECCFCLRGVELEVAPAGPFDTLSCEGFKFLDYLVVVVVFSYCMHS